MQARLSEVILFGYNDMDSLLPWIAGGPHPDVHLTIFVIGTPELDKTYSFL